MGLTADVVLTKVNGVSSSRLGEELVLLDASGEMLRGLNATGGRVFELIDGRASLSVIAERVAAEFRAPKDAVLKDVIGFADALCARKLVSCGEETR